MRRIDDPTADFSDPERPRFQPGDTLTKRLATRIRYWWLNSVQEELAGLVERQLGGLDPDDDTQVEQAIRKLGEGRFLAAPGTKSVATLQDGVLPLTPEDGRHITLIGHGGADFTITGLGDACPVGWSVQLLVPRTTGNSGGVANSLGRFVQFQHTLSGGGLDMTLAARQSGVSTLYTYQAYPDACDAVGNRAALHEQLEFVHLGSGRWRLVALPRPASGSNTHGDYIRHADGTMRCWALRESATQATTAAGGLYRTGTNEWYFPALFSSEPAVSCRSDGSPGLSWGAMGTGVSSGLLCTWSIFSPSSSPTAPQAHLTAIGFWK